MTDLEKELFVGIDSETHLDTNIDDTTTGSKGINLETLNRVTIPISVELGRAELSWNELQSLSEGGVIPLNKKKDAPLMLTVQGNAIAQGEVESIDGEYHIVITKLLGN